MSAQGQLSADQQARIDSLFLHFTDDGSPGASIGVVQHGELIYAKGFGLANVEYQIPNTPQTIFHMASVSKQFTAFAMVLLQDEGKLTLDDEVRTHIPELPDFGEKITIRHLIHHTSGLRDQWNLLAMAGWRLDDVITVDHIMKLVTRQQALNFSPGEQYLYCNTGYTLMAEIVRRVTGQSYGEWMQETVFGPLGMDNTLFYEDHEQIVPDRAYSYYQSPDGLKKSVLSYANAGATSLFTTVEDMAKWAANFRDPVVGSRAIMDTMAQKGMLTNGDTIDYAFGQMVMDYRGVQRIGHGGADAGTYYSPELETYYTLEVEEDHLKAIHQRHPDFDIQIREADEGTSNRWFFSQIAFTRDDAGSVNGMKVSCGRVVDLWFERMD